MVLERPGAFTDRSFPLPEIGDDEFLLRVELVTICGGDLIEYRGGNRKARYPLLMGHELVGRIEEIGPAAARRHAVESGDRVMVEPYIRCGQCARCVAGAYQFCTRGLTYGVTIPSTRPPHLWGAYAQYLYGARGARVHKMAEDVPAAAACLTTVVANGVRWVRTRGRGQVGEGMIVTGLGVQALSSVLVGKIAGLAPIVVVCRERNEDRLRLARTLGADRIVDTAQLASSPAALQELRDLGLELAVECTGAERMFSVAIDALAPTGRLVAVGTRGGQPLGLDLDAVVFKELAVIGGLGQALDTEFAAAIVNSNRYPIADMVSHTFPLTEAQQAIELCLEGREDVIHVALDPWSG
ncbi:MAG TPA: zinc-binding dehydrogenase [Actinomycetes bacterium]|jgi:threonine dehydrogenase-like Zn-dependent dehydrogenase|nr:zinc-binding dehydrogenase [Actinomycetes bacterium]